jgi:hypothetical protein
MKYVRLKNTNIIYFHSYEVAGVDKFTEAESSMELTRAGGRRIRELTGYEFLFEMMKTSYR